MLTRYKRSVKYESGGAGMQELVLRGWGAALSVTSWVTSGYLTSRSFDFLLGTMADLPCGAMRVSGDAHGSEPPNPALGT